LFKPAGQGKQAIDCAKGEYLPGIQTSHATKYKHYDLIPRFFIERVCVVDKTSTNFYKLKVDTPVELLDEDFPATHTVHSVHPFVPLQPSL